MPTVTGIAYWASVTVPNTTFEPTYSVNLIVDQEIATKFKEKGVAIKQMEEGPAVVIKRKVNGPKGMVRNPPTLVNIRAEPVNVAIGNGSKVKVQYKLFDWDYNGRSGVGVDFQGMQILDLVQYESKSKAENEFEDEGENMTNEELEEL
jgi:hypothetical protein